MKLKKKSIKKRLKKKFGKALLQDMIRAAKQWVVNYSPNNPELCRYVEFKNGYIYVGYLIDQDGEYLEEVEIETTGTTIRATQILEKIVLADYDISQIYGLKVVPKY